MSQDFAPASPPPSAGVAELVSYLEGLPEPHILFDTRYRILAANQAYRAQFGTRGSVVGRTCYDVSHHFSVPCDQAGESCPLARSRLSGQRERVLHLHHTPAGEAYVNIELAPVRDAQGRVTCFIEKMEPLRVAQAAPAASGLIGRSAAFRAMLELVARAGPSDASVLLLGESGTGKELVARAVHEASQRASRPLVVVDCASLPETLFESEVFGHDKGAFTGAHAARPGLAEAASGGTLFLDEVGDIPLAMQVKLLRLLESGTYRRVGSTELRRADIRLVSATHRDLRSLVRAGRFREDLYFRLGTFPIRLPALRERPDDIPLLVDSLLERVAPQRHLRLAADAMEGLCAYPFPGNVRELRNVLERAALLTDGDLVSASCIRRALALGGDPADTPVAQHTAHAPSGDAPPVGPPTPALPLRAQAADALRAALAAHQGSRSELAARLGISVRTLYRKLAALERP